MLFISTKEVNIIISHECKKCLTKRKTISISPLAKKNLMTY